MIGEFSGAQVLSDCRRLVINYAPQYISAVDDLTIQQLLDILAEHVHERQHELGEQASTRAWAPVHGFQYEFVNIYAWLVNNRLLHDNALVCEAISDYAQVTYFADRSVAEAIKCSWIDDVITAVDEISVMTYLRVQQLYRLTWQFDVAGSLGRCLTALNKQYEWASTQQSTRSNE